MTRRADAPPSEPGWRDRLRQRDLSNPLVRGLLAIAFVTLLAFVLAPNRLGTPAVTASTVGTVAEFPITASHDFRYQADDPEGLSAVRDRAAASVLQVWDYNVQLGARIDTQVHDAFVDARERLQRVAQNRERADRLRASIEGSGDGSGAPTPAALDALDDDDELPEPVDLDAWVPVPERAEIVAESPLVTTLLAGTVDPDAVLAEIAADGFSVRAEDALRALIRAAMTEHIIEDVRVFDDLQTDGITLRTLEGIRTTDTRVVRRFGRFHDLSDVDDLISQARHHLRYIESVDLQLTIEDVARSLVQVNTVFNRAETNARRREAMDAASEQFRQTLTQTFQAGELIVAAGQIVDDEHYEILEQMYATAPEQAPRAQRVLGAAGLLVLVVFPVLVFALGNLRRFTNDTRDLGMMAFVLIAHVALTDVGSYISELIASNQTTFPPQTLSVALPFAAGAMLVRILTNAENALVYSIVYAVLAGVLFDFDVTYVALALVSSVVASTAVRSAQTRTDILSAGAIVGVVMLGLSLAMMMARGDMSGDMFWVALAASLAGLTSAILVYGLLPFIETVFRYTTPMRLMELANLNHPALKELILKAPGSYHHSMMVGQLVEAACEAVGADALLGRVGAYFHDIGKTKTPQYFAENQSGTNPHDKLKPNMSALVIKAHVKDGVELARQYKLPEEIIHFIREHHGTSLIQYFYRKAQEDSEGEVREEDYRYPGPKPQSRETAICMLADGIEAASRALPDPSHAHLKGLVQRMVNKAFTDGQLDACDLTLKDLNVIGQAFLLRLTAFYHHRPEYPDAAKKPERKPPRPGPPPPTDDDDDRSDDSGSGEADGGGGDDVSEESGVHLRRLEM